MIIILTPEDTPMTDRYDFRPQPRKDYRLFLGEKDIISFSEKSC